MERIWRKHETYVLIAIVILSIVITAINPSFLTLENLLDLMKSYSFLGILSVGVLVVLISGGIDISFTAVATVAEYVMAVIITRHTGNIALAFVIAATIGIMLGLVNASLIYFFHIPTVIATIGTLNIFYGLLIVFSGGKWIYTLPEWFARFSEIRVLTFHNAEGIAFGLSITTFLWILMMLFAAIILRYTALGRKIYAVGGCGFDKGPARRAGINLFKVHVFVYSFMGFTAGVAGVVQALLVQTVAPNSIVGKELDVIAAVVLGGASLAGGVGSVFGTFLGVMLLAFLSNGLTLMRVPSYWYDVAIGLVIIISVSASALQQRRRRRRAISIEEETPAEAAEEA